MMFRKKKVMLFIVEGISDKQALERILRKIYRHDSVVEFRVANGDLTGFGLTNSRTGIEESVTQENVLDKIWDIVDDFRKDQKLEKSDIMCIVHLLDMDGVYIPDTAIEQGNCEGFLYCPDKIVAKDVTKVIERNQHKREIINFLNSVTDIKNILYEMYYMSCNLDHALYNEQNLDASLKVIKADEFYEKFDGQENKFIEFINDEVKNGVPEGKLVSWAFIKQDLHSLERHTNLHVFFSQHPIVSGLL